MRPVARNLMHDHYRPSQPTAPGATTLYFDTTSGGPVAPLADAAVPTIERIAPAPALNKAVRTDASPSGSVTNPWERRKSTRHPAVEYRLWLAWWKGHEFLIHGAQLINVSEGGVLVLVAEAPTEGQHLWMRLEGTDPVEDVRAIVLETARVGFGGYAVRLEYTEPCPTGFYLTAIEGLELSLTS
jgi:hypothetical protein